MQPINCFPRKYDLKSFFFSATSILVFSCSTLIAEDVGQSIETINQLELGGVKNVEAVKAMENLVSSNEGYTLVEIMDSMGTENLLARNYYRSAIESLYDRLVAEEREIPVDAIFNMAADEEKNVPGREMAFAVLEMHRPQMADKMLDSMMDDPSNRLRRKAVAKKLDELKEKEPDLSDSDTIKEYRTVLSSARDEDQFKSIIKKLEDMGETVDIPTQMGFITKWQVVGPFDNTDMIAAKTKYDPESKIDLEAKYQGKLGKNVTWSPFSTEEDYGELDINKYYGEDTNEFNKKNGQRPPVDKVNATFGDMKGTVTYAFSEFTCDKEMECEIRIGSISGFTLFVNGEPQFERLEFHRGMEIDQYVIPVKLNQGNNEILMKVYQDEQKLFYTYQYSFQLRVCDRTGKAILSTTR